MNAYEAMDLSKANRRDNTPLFLHMINRDTQYGLSRLIKHNIVEAAKNGESALLLPLKDEYFVAKEDKGSLIQALIADIQNDGYLVDQIPLDGIEYLAIRWPDRQEPNVAWHKSHGKVLVLATHDDGTADVVIQTKKQKGDELRVSQELLLYPSHNVEGCSVQVMIEREPGHMVVARPKVMIDLDE